MSFDASQCPPCPRCGAAPTVTEHPDVETLWAVTCRACRWEWVDLTEPPSWALLAKFDKRVALLLKVIGGGW